MLRRPMSITIQVGRVVGLCNLRYVPEINRFELDGGFMLLYWVLLDLLYLVATPCILVVMVNSYYECQDMDMLAAAYTVVALTKAIAALVMLSSLWLRRQRVLRLGNGFLAVIERYRRQLSEYAYWRRHFFKMTLYCARFLVLVHQLFGPRSALMCGEDDTQITEVPPMYLVLALACLLMETVLSCTDLLVYFLMDTCSCVLECMALEVRALSKDTRWLPQRHGRYRDIYQRQLLQGWQLVWRYCVRLDNLLVQMRHIFQWQMLLNVFTNYLIDITIIFNLMVYFSEGDYVSPGRLAFYVVLSVSYHLDIMTHFSIFARNDVHWKYLSTRIQKFWLVQCKVNMNWVDNNTNGIALMRQLEFAVIYLNRKLQPRPERVRRLHIAGLFDLNRNSVFSMSASITMNVIILCQIAYKEYY